MQNYSCQLYLAIEYSGWMFLNRLIYSFRMCNEKENKRGKFGVLKKMTRGKFGVLKTFLVLLNVVAY